MNLMAVPRRAHFCRRPGGSITNTSALCFTWMLARYVRSCGPGRKWDEELRSGWVRDARRDHREIHGLSVSGEFDSRNLCRVEEEV